MSEIKEIMEVVLESLDLHTTELGLPELKQAMYDIREGIEGDFDFTLELGPHEVRIICEGEIDSILLEELESDPYCLRCFNTWAIVEATDFPEEMVEACKKEDAFEALGKGIIATGGTKTLIELLVSHDGYGHHFNPEDGETYECQGWYVFPQS